MFLMLPNADRLQQIILSCCGNWDAEEADFQSIAVEIGLKDKDLVEYNRAFREGRTEFPPAASAPEVAAASHSHLNLAMHGVRDGATATIPGIMRFCSDGRLSIEIIQRVDKEMADHCQRGLLWEVLSYMMAVEELSAFEIIQAALNAKDG